MIVRNSIFSARLAGASALALVALVQAPAAAQTVAPAAPAPAVAAPPAATFAEVPGVKVNYYDVTGATIEEIRASIDSQRPKDAVTGQAAQSRATWSMGASWKKATTGSVCKIASAKVTFQGEALMPRLANEAAVSPEVLAKWREYVTGFEDRQARYLRFAAERTGEIERAILASSCDGAKDAASAAIADLKKRQAEQQQQPVPVPPVPTS